MAATLAERSRASASARQRWSSPIMPARKVVTAPELTLGLAILTALSLNPFDPESPLVTGVEEVEFVPLACATVRRAAWDEAAGLDERFFFYFEDQDLCRRLRSLGWRIAVDWDAVAVHVGGGSSATRDEQRWFLEYVRSRARSTSASTTASAGRSSPSSGCRWPSPRRRSGPCRSGPAPGVGTGMAACRPRRRQRLSDRRRSPSEYAPAR